MKSSLQESKTDEVNKTYIIVVSLLTFIFPTAGLVIEHLANGNALTFELFSRWFIFFAAGLRLFLAGIRQTTNPAFTAKQIFHVNDPQSFPIVREVGFGNLCFGLIAIISLFKPEWRTVSAFASGLYYGLAGLLHLFKKTTGINEKFALWTDLLIFAVLMVYFIQSI